MIEVPKFQTPDPSSKNVAKMKFKDRVQNNPFIDNLLRPIIQ